MNLILKWWLIYQKTAVRNRGKRVSFVLGPIFFSKSSKINNNRSDYFSKSSKNNNKRIYDGLAEIRPRITSTHHLLIAQLVSSVAG
jgi:hypothetical protein